MLNTKTIGNRIAEARKKTTISQAQLAERLFISAQAVGKWERGESMPDILTLNRLAEILGVDLNYFSEGLKPGGTEMASEGSAKTSDAAAFEKQEKTLKWDMSRGNWAGADFSGLKELHEKFSSSNMQNCKFIGSDLSGLLLSNNNVQGCDFSSSDISSSQIKGSMLSNNVFRNCLLKETEFSGSYVSGCDFTDADLTGVVIRSGGFEKNVFTGAVLNRTSFIDSGIADITFEGKVENAYFENCGFSRVTFQNATLTNTFFKCKSLKRLRFIDCMADRMTYEFLKNGKADLTGITLMTS